MYKYTIISTYRSKFVEYVLVLMMLSDDFRPSIYMGDASYSTAPASTMMVKLMNGNSKMNSVDQTITS